MRLASVLFNFARGRRPQFGLKAAFAALLLISVGLTPLAYWWQAIRTDESIVADLKSRSVSIATFDKAVLLATPDQHPKPEYPPQWFCQLIGRPNFHEAKGIHVDNSSRIEGRQFEQIWRLRHVGRFFIHKSGLKPSELVGLGQLQELLRVEIEGCQLSNDLTSKLGGISTLTEIELSKCSLPKASLKALGGLKNLVRLGLSATQVTDVDIRELSDLPQLQIINLTGTLVTVEGARDLCKFPSLKWVGVKAVFDSFGGDPSHPITFSQLRELNSNSKIEFVYEYY